MNTASHQGFSLVSPESNERFITRIHALTPRSQALWGKMNVTQMLMHCNIVLRNGLGDVKLPKVWIGLIIGNSFKKKILTEGFGKNIPTLKGAKMTDITIVDEHQFEQERTKIIDLLRRFSSGGLRAITHRPHPFFGKMTQAEWDVFEAKHLDHHLRQFGV
ncbi:MAG: DUF1569 domain-containing protein [Candidatus Kapaibacteriota bacterium]